MADDAGDSDEDWLLDFGTRAKTDAALRSWPARLSGDENAEVRQLISDSLALRWCARLLLDRLRRLEPDGNLAEDRAQAPGHPRPIVWHRAAE